MGSGLLGLPQAVPPRPLHRVLRQRRFPLDLVPRAASRPRSFIRPRVNPLRVRKQDAAGFKAAARMIPGLFDLSYLADVSCHVL